jgi:hypothetical protein
MRISQTVQTIAENYEGDGEISVIGLMPTGDIIQMVIDRFEGVDYVWPGYKFLPYGGIYYNRIIVAVADYDDETATSQIKELADSIKAGEDEYGEDEYGEDDFIPETCDDGIYDPYLD